MARKATVTTDEPKFLHTSRSGFVKSLPIDMPAEEVIQLGKESGLNILMTDIHSSRYYMRQQLEQTLVALPPKKPPVVQMVSPAVDTPPSLSKVLPEEDQGFARELNMLVQAEPTKESAGEQADMIEQLRALVLRLGTRRAVQVIQSIQQAFGTSQ